MNDVLDALYSAAESDDGRINGDHSIDAPATSSRRRIAVTKNTVQRFLEALPEDMTAHEILLALDSER